jgi:hypothetical protein
MDCFLRYIQHYSYLLYITFAHTLASFIYMTYSHFHFFGSSWQAGCPRSLVSYTSSCYERSLSYPRESGFLSIETITIGTTMSTLLYCHGSWNWNFAHSSCSFQVNFYISLISTEIGITSFAKKWKKQIRKYWILQVLSFSDFCCSFIIYNVLYCLNNMTGIKL